MATIPVTPDVVQDIVDNADERELWIVGREFERPPYFHAGKGGDTRLARALRVCVEGRITPNSDGSYTVEGSEHRTYRVTESCSCPQSQKAQSKWCYHAVSVALYVEWQRRLRPTAPVVLGTLRPGTLPLPPTTADEHLAHAAPAEPQGRITVDGVLSPPPMPQEDRMPDDEYLPEPDEQDTPMTVLEAADADFPPMGQPVTRALQPRPTQDADLEQALQAWTAQRAVVQRFLKTQMHEGNDFYSLRIKGRETKPVLSKAGSEKFLGLLQLHASFAQDTATWTMLGQPEGTLCYVCTLHNRNGDVVGEGRGARTIQQDGGDINKAIKMACKSSQVDAVLRTGALSDVFTQDLEPETATEPVKAAPAQPTAQAYRQRIWAIVQAQAPDMRTREQVEAWIHAETGSMLHPDRYADILAALERRA